MAQREVARYLSIAVLIGLLSSALAGIRSADPSAALVIAAVAFNEGAESWRGEESAEGWRDAGVAVGGRRSLPAR